MVEIKDIVAVPSQSEQGGAYCHKTTERHGWHITRMVEIEDTLWCTTDRSEVRQHGQRKNQEDELERWSWNISVRMCVSYIICIH
jgi:hypothetical protein